MSTCNLTRTCAALAIVALLAPVAGAAESGKTGDQGPGNAEDAGWELVFSDDFERDELGANWISANGKWDVKDGMLRGSGTLISSQGFPPSDEPPGYQRLEFDAVTDVQPLAFLQTGPNKPEVRISDLSCFIQAPPHNEGNGPPYHQGYFFQFGGHWNSANRIMKSGDTLVADDEDPDVKIEADKTHHIVVENDKGQLRFYVDGQLVLEYDERMSMIGAKHNRIGFYFYTAAKVDDVKLYVKQLPNGLDTD